LVLELLFLSVMCQLWFSKWSMFSSLLSNVAER